jgi:hypothetical protein
MNADASGRWGAVERPPQIRDRLKGVVIVNRPALEVIR